MHLVVTREMLRQAKGNRAAGTILMHPRDFLYLTTSSNDHLLEGKEVEDLTHYNEWARNNSIIIMPFLTISLDGYAGAGKHVSVGRVLSHEGRHRARSLLNAGGNVLMVALEGAFGGRTVHKLESGTRGTSSFRSRHVDIQDFPSVVVGEFDPTRNVKLNVKSFKSFWS